MPNAGFNLDKFLKRIARQRVAEPGDVELLAELLTEALAREKRLTEALQSVAAALYTRPHTEWSYHERLAYDAVRAVLADEEPPE